MDAVAALTAEALGVLQSEEAELARSIEELARELTALLPLALLGHDLALDQRRTVARSSSCSESNGGTTAAARCP